jgi:hypothetical protein
VKYPKIDYMSQKHIKTAPVLQFDHPPSASPLLRFPNRFPPTLLCLPPPLLCLPPSLLRLPASLLRRPPSLLDRTPWPLCSSTLLPPHETVSPFVPATAAQTLYYALPALAPAYWGVHLFRRHTVQNCAPSGVQVCRLEAGIVAAGESVAGLSESHPGYMVVMVVVVVVR